MALTDMMLDATEAKEEAGISESDAPKYPYGLQLCLNDEALEKLQLDPLPPIGTVLTLVAQVKVTGVRSYEIQTEKTAGEPDENQESSVDLQITAMELQPADKPSAAERLYGKK